MARPRLNSEQLPYGRLSPLHNKAFDAPVPSNANLALTQSLKLRQEDLLLLTRLQYQQGWIKDISTTHRDGSYILTYCSAYSPHRKPMQRSANNLSPFPIFEIQEDLNVTYDKPNSMEHQCLMTLTQIQ